MSSSGQVQSDAFWSVTAVLALSLLACRSRDNTGQPATRVVSAALPLPLGAAGAPAAPRPRASPALPPGFLKGQLHAHTNRSGDSHTPPEEAQRFYQERGYDFVVFTDHNVITDTADSSVLTFRGIEITQNLATCEPPPEFGFPCLMHVGGIFLSADEGPVAPRLPQPSMALGAPPSLVRDDYFAYGKQLAEQLGGMAVLNHPNMRFGADRERVLHLAERGLRFLEVGNQAWDAVNEGDASHPSTEALWDHVLTRGHRVWGIVTDDAHHYFDAAEASKRQDEVFVADLGFVAVAAEKNEAAIRKALSEGAFYGSTGVVFERLSLKPERLEIDATRPVSFVVIGDGGAKLHEVRTQHLSYLPDWKSTSYLRIRAWDHEGQIALTQPVFRPTPQ